MQDRMEQGGWIVKNGNEYSFEAFPDSWNGGSCGWTLPDNWRDDIPDGLAGWVHSHPFFTGEDVSAACEDAKDPIYTNQPSYDDGIFHTRLCGAIGSNEIKGYVIDGNGIRVFDHYFQLFKTYNSLNRCGY